MHGQHDVLVPYLVTRAIVNISHCDFHLILILQYDSDYHEEFPDIVTAQICYCTVG